MNIVMIASEAVPFAKTGGLADVVGALPKALAEQKDRVSVIMPSYGQKIDAAAYGIRPVEGSKGEVNVRVGALDVRGKILTCELDGVTFYFITQPAYFDRAELYSTSAGDYPDNAARFSFFARAAVEAMINLDLKPDIVHAHDWQAALVPVYLRTLYRESATFAKARSLLTIHNLGYQGVFPKDDLMLTGLGWDVFTFDKLEYWGKICFLKGGISFADAISTVSKKYAKEVLAPEQGMGLDAALAYRSGVLTGILNGVDYSAWSPANDDLIPATFEPGRMEGKKACRKALRKQYKLPESNAPLIGIVSRLASQKGFDILVKAMPKLMKHDLQIAVLGTGDDVYHRMFSKLAKQYPKHLGLKLAFDNKLAHLIEAGADMFLMPSRYEPCGLNQIISLKYGTIPIVRATGGLDDTIEEFKPKTSKGNGFKFKDYSPTALTRAVEKALAAFSQPAQWKALIANAMQCDFSWTRSAKEYRKLYRNMLKG
jgi:starch synthase